MQLKTQVFAEMIRFPWDDDKSCASEADQVHKFFLVEALAHTLEHDQLKSTCLAILFFSCPKKETGSRVEPCIFVIITCNQVLTLVISWMYICI